VLVPFQAAASMQEHDGWEWTRPLGFLEISRQYQVCVLYRPPAISLIAT